MKLKSTNVMAIWRRNSCGCIRAVSYTHLWTAQRLVRKQKALGQPSFLYFFDHGYPAADDAGLHGFHASELPFVFGTFDATPPHWPKIPATPVETKLSDAMIGYWSSFARTGHPKAANEPDWPSFGATGSYLSLIHI